MGSSGVDGDRRTGSLNGRAPCETAGVRRVLSNDLRRDVVVLGGSAGGIAALRDVLAFLPADLPASFLLVLHAAGDASGRLAQVLDKVGSLPVKPAVDGEAMEPGQMYVAGTDRHLLIGDHDTVRLGRGPRENRVRPAVDPLFRSAARWCGPRVIGVVLSGALDDGAAGLATIGQRGGLTLVQQPRDARFDGMPRAAIKAVPDARVVPARQLGAALATLVGQPAPDVSARVDDNLIWQTDMAEHGASALRHAGRPAGLGCPECSGGLSVVETGNAVQYVCHTGHAYSPESLLAARDENIESALWTAISALQERAAVLTDLARRAEQAGNGDGRLHRRAAEEAERAAAVLRNQLTNDDRR
jgi:two-component system chemotaxis response regulator CheB